MSALLEVEEVRTKDVPEDVKGVQLTSNAIPKLLDGESIPNLILQVLTYRAIEDVNDEILHRLSLSDGTNYTTFAITSQTLVEKYQIEEFSIIEISKFQRIPVTNNEETKYLLIIQNFEKQQQVSGVVGDPKDVDRVIDNDALDSTTVVTYSESQAEAIVMENLIFRGV